MLDTARRSVATTIPASTIHRIGTDPVNHIAYVTSHEGLLLVDTNTRAATGSIDVPGNTLDVAVDPETHTGFVVISVAGLGVVDLAARKFGWALEPRPGGVSDNAAVAADLVSHKVYLATNWDLWILDTAAPIHGDGQIQLDLTSAAVAVDPTTHLVYVAGTGTGIGELAVADTTTRTVTATIPVGQKPSSIAVDPTTHTVYVTNYDDNTLSVVDATTNTVKATIPVGHKPAGVAVDPTTHTVYVTNYDDGTLSIITHR
ncbi:YncE family protein [Nocardia sp. NPDC051570]|uniref:YncE family protein n=1 Tax=Nocardia sp. NPDC051570 TaxID=3364324 RepID=UPI0037A7D858